MAASLCYCVDSKGLTYGWLLDNDAQHRPVTRNATKVQKGVEAIHFDKF